MFCVFSANTKKRGVRAIVGASMRRSPLSAIGPSTVPNPLPLNPTPVTFVGELWFGHPDQLVIVDGPPVGDLMPIIADGLAHDGLTARSALSQIDALVRRWMGRS